MFVSLFTNTQVSPDIGVWLSANFGVLYERDIDLLLAMMGEILLVGQVLPVGGLTEKILAAHQAGIKTMVAPGANRADVEDNILESVMMGVRFVYVEEVLHEVFLGRTSHCEIERFSCAGVMHVFDTLFCAILVDVRQARQYSCAYNSFYKVNDVNLHS